MSKTTEAITLILEQAKLKNMKVWDYLLQICVLLSSPLLAQVQVELQEYMIQCQDSSMLMDSPLDQVLGDDPAFYSKVKDALVGEVKVNMRLRQLVQMCQVEIQGRQAEGQSVPDCQTSWIFKDFPVLLELFPAPTQPLTVLCDHILDRYDLDKDEKFKRTTLRLEVACLWHHNSRQAQCRDRVLRRLEATEESVPEPQPATDSPATAESVTAGVETVPTPQPVKGFSSTYTKVASSDKPDDLVLRLLRRPGYADIDLLSMEAISGILRESVSGESRLEGAGYLVYREKKLARRRRKAAALELETCTDPAPAPAGLAVQLSVSVPVQENPSNVPTKPDPREESRRAFLNHVAKFQSKLRAAAKVTAVAGKGMKRKASDSSVCREIQTKHAKSRMETTLTALRRSVTKRQTLGSCR